MPAIDLRGGRCVRLAQGRFDAETLREETWSPLWWVYLVGEGLFGLSGYATVLVPIFFIGCFLIHPWLGVLA